MKIYKVGGAVRDRLMGLEPKDTDWVIVGSSISELEKKGFQQVGKDFPVFLHPDTKEEYVRLAKSFAFNVGAANKLRKSLRLTLANSKLCQGKSYAQTLEVAYRNMWTKWCVSLKQEG